MAEEHEEEGPVTDDEEACAVISPSAQRLLDEKDLKISELTDDLKRLQAEFENFRKRTERETSEKVRFANNLLIKDLLMVVDSLDKAIEETGKVDGKGSECEGFKKVRRQLMQILEREGLKAIDTRGRFDPFLHEAVLREEREDAEDGKILEVYQKGYVLGHQAIRPAKVKVAKKKEPALEPEQAKGKATEESQSESDEGESNG